MRRDDQAWSFDARLLLSQPVLALDQAREVGRVTGILVERASSSVTAVRVQPRRGRAANVPFGAFRRLDPGLAAIRSEGLLHERLVNAANGCLEPRLWGHPVVTQGGQMVGRVASFEVWRGTGHVDLYRVRLQRSLVARLLELRPSPVLDLPVDLVASIGERSLVIRDGALALVRMARNAGR